MDRVRRPAATVPLALDGDHVRKRLISVQPLGRVQLAHTRRMRQWPFLTGKRGDRTPGRPDWCSCHRPTRPVFRHRTDNVFGRDGTAGIEHWPGTARIDRQTGTLARSRTGLRKMGGAEKIVLDRDGIGSDTRCCPDLRVGPGCQPPVTESHDRKDFTRTFQLMTLSISRLFLSASVS